MTPPSQNRPAGRSIRMRTGALLALGFLVVTLALSLHRATPDRAPVFDETWYLSLAVDLHDGAADLDRISVMPLYPAYLWAVLASDASALASARCMVERMASPAVSCVNDYGWILWPQSILLAVAMAAAVWALYRYLGGLWPALGGGAFILAAGEPLRYADHYLTEAASFPLFLLFSAAFLAAVRNRTFAACLVAGILLGLVALTRASFIFAIVPAALALVMTGGGANGRSRPAAVLLVGFALLMAPYFSITSNTRDSWMPGSSTPVLTVRIAYNDMTPREWLAGWIYWIPRIGDNLAAVLFKPEDVERLKFDGKDSFYTASHQRINEEAGRNGGRTWLIEEKIFRDLPWHLTVSLLMAWQAGFIGGVWGAFGLLAVFLCAVRPGWTGGRFKDLATITAVPLFIMGVQAFTAPPIDRYNIFMLLPMGACLSQLALQLAAAAGTRLKAAIGRRDAG